MRIFLFTSVIAMLAAGIYGTIDLTLDLKNGTFIEYEDEEFVAISAFSGKSKGIFTENPVKQMSAKKMLYTERTTKKLADVKLKDFSLSDIELSDFSRGEPPMMYETLLLDQMAPDIFANEEVSMAMKDTVAALRAKTHKDSVPAVEERKFNIKLFSRGRPPRPVKKEKEELALQNDSTRVR